MMGYILNLIRGFSRILLDIPFRKIYGTFCWFSFAIIVMIILGSTSFIWVPMLVLWGPIVLLIIFILDQLKVSGLLNSPKSFIYINFLIIIVILSEWFS